MRINYSFVEFHAPFFCKGKNFPSKVTAGPDIQLYYDSSIPNAKMCMLYKGLLTTFDTYHSAAMTAESQNTFCVQHDVTPSNLTEGKFGNAIPSKPHHASKEARALRAAQSSSQGE